MVVNRIEFRIGMNVRRHEGNNKKALSELQRLAKAYRTLPEAQINAMKESGDEVAGHLIRSAKRRAPSWSGTLRRSIGFISETTNKNGNVMVVGALAPYAVFQEEGFAPHRVWRHQFTRINKPGFTKFWRWMKDRGINRRGVNGLTVSRHKPFMAPAYRFAAARSMGIYSAKIEAMYRKQFSRRAGRSRPARKYLGRAEI